MLSPWLKRCVCYVLVRYVLRHVVLPHLLTISSYYVICCYLFCCTSFVAIFSVTSTPRVAIKALSGSSSAARMRNLGPSAGRPGFRLSATLRRLIGAHVRVRVCRRYAGASAIVPCSLAFCCWNLCCSRRCLYVAHDAQSWNCRLMSFSSHNHVRIVLVRTISDAATISRRAPQMRSCHRASSRVFAGPCSSSK
jgi:hypothetical protein